LQVSYKLAERNVNRTANEKTLILFSANFAECIIREDCQDENSKRQSILAGRIKNALLQLAMRCYANLDPAKHQISPERKA
jgi:hypothetical protein